MSLVCAKIDNNTISIAADSIIVKDGLKRSNFKKLLNINNMIIGGCGTAEELSLFFEFVKDHKPLEPTIRGIHDFLLEFSKILSTYIDDSTIKNSYIIVYEDHVFEVEGMFVQEVFDYVAIGDGEDFALTALYLGHSVEEAVKVAAAFCCNVSLPVVEYTHYRHS